ncbi:MAG: hypothetical protein PHE54_02830 [Bacilli bacterium]|nr:hypothetical protein [Bacilli bacterium]
MNDTYLSKLKSDKRINFITIKDNTIMFSVVRDFCQKKNIKLFVINEGYHELCSFENQIVNISIN